MTRLTRNFTLDELVLSDYAIRNDLDNTPNDEQIENLRILCFNVLQPLREVLGKPVIVTSGYRSPVVNKAIGGATTSQHIKGQAADIHVPEMSIQELYDFIKANLPFDQLIQEFGRWVHVSYNASSNRRECLYAVRENGTTVYKKDIA